MKSVAKTVKKELNEALYESVMHLVNEGAGAGYTVEISDLKLGNFKVLGTKFVNNGHEEKVAKEQLEEAKAFKAELETKEITVTLKVGEGGRTFGSVSTKELSEAVKEQLGYDIDKKKMQLSTPIRELGVTRVPIRLHTKVTAELKVNIKEA